MTSQQIAPQIVSRQGAAVPFIVGNLGARAIMARAKGEPVVRDPLLDRLQHFADLGAEAVEDYVGWNVLEPRSGEPEFSSVLEHRDAARRLGLTYVIYPWVHALPAWLADEGKFEPARCCEHGTPTAWPSIFAPSTLELYERFYALLARHLGSDLEAITLAYPSDYGEYGFPTGMGAWVFGATNENSHFHEGFWCGDDAAGASFRRAMLSRFGSLAAVNAVFGTAHVREDDLRPPPDLALASLSARGRIEIVEWYRSSLLDFTRRMIAIARRHFPQARLAIKCGYAGELAGYGHDYARLLPLLRSERMTLWSTHGTLPTLFHKRIASLCREHGVPYFTEGVSERTRNEFRDRLYEDAADGSQCFFEFHDTVDQFEDDFVDHRPLLTGEAPETQVAVIYDALGQVLTPQRAAPPGIHAIAEPLRDIVDYSIFDEATIAATHALVSHPVVVVPDPGPIAAEALATLRHHVECGAVLVVSAREPLRALGGEAPEWTIPDPRHAEPCALHELEFESLDQPSRIDFGNGDDWFLTGAYAGIESAAPYFVHPAHERARWTTARSGFRIARATIDDAVLEIRLHADERALREPFVVTCDGMTIAELKDAGEHTLRFVVASRAEKDTPTMALEFRGRSFRPAESGGSDQRELGILLHGARLFDPRSNDLEPAPRILARANAAGILGQRFRRIGRGGVLFSPHDDPMALAAFTRCALEQRATFVQHAIDLDSGNRHALAGLRIARTANRLLVYNRSDRPLSADVFGREFDLGPREIQSRKL